MKDYSLEWMVCGDIVYCVDAFLSLDITIDVGCTFDGPNPIHPIAFRTHAHSRSKLTF